MQLIIKPTNSTLYSFKLEHGDELYHHCMWGRVILDHDAYTLFAETDCGNYTYGWKPSPEHESFLQLMARIEEEYLLSKIADRNTILFEPSVEKTIKNIKEVFSGRPEKEVNEICTAVREIDRYSDEGFFYEVDDILSHYGYTDALHIVEIEKDYPLRAKTFAKIFCTIIQPAIRRQLSESANAQS